jgi:hypothetical protein
MRIGGYDKTMKDEKENGTGKKRGRGTKNQYGRKKDKDERG